MMTHTPPPTVCKECRETRHVVGDCPYTQALKEVNYASGKVLVMTPTLIPTTKGGEITHTSLGKSGEIKGKV